jgi:serine/threonine protein kinase
MTPPAVRDELSLESLVAEVADEFLERQRNGEQPDVEEYAARHPQAAELLRRVLVSLQWIGTSLRDGPAADPNAEPSAASTLGDFRLIREIGRGGMGVVYEAEQVSLGRRVALKVLPFAGALDARRLQRFKNEAQAAAHLHHTNIVPVFYVGFDRGVHYYAMQLIEGCTLAALIRELRQVTGGNLPSTQDPPVPLSEVAHSLLTGVMAHVDPGAGNSPPGVPAWPAAPAPNRHAPCGDGAGAGGTAAASTAAVAVLSTERSTKSPAFFRTLARLGTQAAEALEHAHGMGVIHRDVKPGNLLLDDRGHLWITDFGLAQFNAEANLTLTGDILGTLRYMSPEQSMAQRVVIDHRTDIYSLGVTLYELLTLQPAIAGRDRAQILRQIAFEEPVPPRRIHNAIPAELETIVQKAIEKNPGDRYATAQELADDLRRFLDDKPVRARRPSLLKRSRRWCRRHQPVVWSVFGVISLALVMALASFGYITHRMAGENQRIAKERDDARAQRKRARQAVDTMYTQVAENWMSVQPAMEELQKDFLAAALQFYQEFAETESTDPQDLFEIAKAYQRVGRMQQMVFRNNDKARHPLFRSQSILERLAARFPEEPAYLHELTGTYTLLAWATGEEEKWQGLAVQYAERLVEAYPRNSAFRRALARGLYNLSFPHISQGRLDTAELLCRRAIAVLEETPRSSAQSPPDVIFLGLSYSSLGRSLEQQGKLLEAQRAVAKGIDVLLPLSGSDPNILDFRYGLSPWHWMLFGKMHVAAGTLLRRLGHPGQGRAYVERAISIHRQLFTSFPKSSAYLQHLIGSYQAWFQFERQSPSAGLDVAALHHALQTADRVFPDYPEQAATYATFLLNCPDVRFQDRKRALHVAERTGDAMILAWALYRNGRYADALSATQKNEGSPGHDIKRGIQFGFLRAMSYQQLGESAKADKCFLEAARLLQNHFPGDEEMNQERDEAAALLGVRVLENTSKLSRANSAQCK